MTSKTKPKIFLVVFARQYDLTSTLLRIAEFEESPEFKNKAFTHTEYADWYANQYGAFTYYTDWDGYNLKPSSLKPFYRGKFDPLIEKEKLFLDLFRDYFKRRKSFYIVAINAEKNSLSTLRHEFIHALFYLYPEYRKIVIRYLRTRAEDAPVFYNLLKKMGYHSSLYRDEFNAYLTTGLTPSFKGLKRKARSFARDLQAIFREYFGYSIERASKARIFKEVEVIYFHC